MNFNDMFRKCSACSVTQKTAQANKYGLVPLVPLVPWQRARARRREQNFKFFKPLSRVHFFAEHAEQTEQPRRYWATAILKKRNKRNTCGTHQMNQKTKPLRDLMPSTSAFLDECGTAFGFESVGESIRAGMAGLPGFFYASENGHEVGTPIPEAKVYTCMTRKILPETLLPKADEYRMTRK